MMRYFSFISSFIQESHTIGSQSTVADDEKKN